MAASNSTKTIHRFISKRDGSFKIHIHTPDDKILSRSVGYKKIGEKAALKKAVKLRNDLGFAMWGKHWRRVLSDETLFLRLPHSFEPNHGYDKCGDGYVMEVCRANITAKDGTKFCRKRSVNKYGRKGAYLETKKIMLDYYADVIELMIYMGRITEKQVKLGLNQ